MTFIDRFTGITNTPTTKYIAISSLLLWISPLETIKQLQENNAGIIGNDLRIK